MTTQIEEVRSLIAETDGKIAKLRFIKRSTGDERTMRVRLGVKRDVKGVGQSYDPLSKGLLTIFDMDHDNGEGKKRGRHKNIPLDGVLEITCGDLRYQPPPKAT